MKQRTRDLGYPPSTYAIDDFIKGEEGSTLRVAGLTLGRSVLIAPGLLIAGTPYDRVVKTSLWVSGTITLGMMLVQSFQQPRRR